MNEEEQVTPQEKPKTEYVYGIEMPDLQEGMQPLEAVVLIQGIMMETGMPTIVAMGSEGMTPWMAVGMMAVETQRLTMGYSLHAVAMDLENDEDEDDA